MGSANHARGLPVWPSKGRPRRGVRQALIYSYARAMPPQAIEDKYLNGF
jgi:hypothetical protein